MIVAIRQKNRKFVPLNALRVFDIAARRLSFTRAAEELRVTTAAVSHQIRLLEAHLQLKLFERENNLLSLTPQGRQYLTHISEAFRIIELGTSRLLKAQNTVLKVVVPPSFGAKWLVPRLHSFFQQHPNFSIEIISDTQPVIGCADIVVGFQPMPVQKLTMVPLIVSDFFPVCSASLASDLRTPQDLARHPLLHEENAAIDADYPDWAGWLSVAKVEGINPYHGAKFSLALMALEAAIEGQGVALAQHILVEADIAAGRLVRLFDVEIPQRIAYYLGHASGGSTAIGFQAFYHWLIEEARCAVASKSPC